MSDYVRYKGTFKKVPLKMSQTLEQKCYQILVENGIKVDTEHYESHLEQILWNLDDYFYHKESNSLYRFLSKEQFDCIDSYCNITPVDSNTFKFETQFYNGGTCLDECLIETLNKNE